MLLKTFGGLVSLKINLYIVVYRHLKFKRYNKARLSSLYLFSCTVVCLRSVLFYLYYFLLIYIKYL